MNVMSGQLYILMHTVLVANVYAIAHDMSEAHCRDISLLAIVICTDTLVAGTSYLSMHQCR